MNMSTTNTIYEPGHVWPHIRDLTLHLNRNVISHHLQPQGADITGTDSMEHTTPNERACDVFYDIERYLR